MNRTLSPSRPSFLVLPENRFAHAAITEPDDVQALFLYGPSGVGKTLLAEMAIDRVTARIARPRIQSLTASQFAAEFSEASVNKTIPLFQTLTRQLDLLILEDLQALEGRPETQVQLLSLTNELLSTGCEIVWTCGKSPGGLESFLPRLVSRFRGGILASVRPPGAESRLALLRHFAGELRIKAAPAALGLLSQELAVSPRELLATIQRLAVQARQERGPVDSDLVRRFLQQDLPPARLKLPDICRAVARQFGSTAGELRSRSLARKATLPRQCALSLARELTSASVEAIGAFFGGRDHSTVVHACQRLSQRVEADPELKASLNQVRHMLGAAPQGPIAPAVDDLSND